MLFIGCQILVCCTIMLTFVGTKTINSNSMLKKFFYGVFAALVCGTVMFTSCKSDKDDKSDSDSNVAEKLVGKWVDRESNGVKLTTGDVTVTTFVMEGSVLKAYTSISEKDYNLWAYRQPTDVAIDGNNVTLTMKAGNITTVEKMSDITITGDDLRYTSLYTVMRDGKEVASFGPDQLYSTKVHDDYAPIFIGRWEGTITTDEPGVEPQPFCEEYLTNGTNVEYRRVNGQWEPVKADYAEFFVDGNLLCTRWKYADGEEMRTNCIFESYVGGTMILKEVVKLGGQLYTETSTLKKVSK